MGATVCAAPGGTVAGIADGATVLVGRFGMAGMPGAGDRRALIDQGATDLTVVSQRRQRRHRPVAALLARAGSRG